MILIKILLILIATVGFLIFSFSSKLKIFQRLFLIIGYAALFFLILYPAYADKIAHIFSIKSGTDLVVYIVLSLTVLMNVILYVGQKNHHKVLTKIIRETAIKDAKKC